MCVSCRLPAESTAQSPPLKLEKAGVKVAAYTVPDLAVDGVPKDEEEGAWEEDLLTSNKELLNSWISNRGLHFDSLFLSESLCIARCH